MDAVTPDSAPNPWTPETDPRRLKLLGKLAEELNECGSAVARCIIQGLDEAEPVTGKVNRVWLEDEIADVATNLRLVIEHLGLDQRRVLDRSYRKEAFLTAWLKMMSPAGAGSAAVLEVIAERRRQVEAEGWSAEHDDKYALGELSLAASAYAAHAAFQIDGTGGLGQLARKLWPWNWTWWKPKDRRRNLVRAGALIVAELERMDRAGERS